MDSKKGAQLFIILSFFFMSALYAQTSKYRPFKLVIIAPDTAIIDSKLFKFIDTIQDNHLKAYYQSIKQMQQMIDFKDYPKNEANRFENTKERVKKNLEEAKKAEPDVKKFKYFQTISEYSDEVLNFYFNEYPPLSTIGTVGTQKTDIKSLGRLADSLKADYVIYYHDIHTESSDGQYLLKLHTCLYNNATRRLLFDTETTGDTLSRGDMWTCMDPLSCLLVTCVKSSTDTLFSILRKNQLK